MAKKKMICNFLFTIFIVCSFVAVFYSCAHDEKKQNDNKIPVKQETRVHTNYKNKLEECENAFNTVHSNGWEYRYMYKGMAFSEKNDVLIVYVNAKSFSSLSTEEMKTLTKGCVASWHTITHTRGIDLSQDFQLFIADADDHDKVLSKWDSVMGPVPNFIK